MKHTLLFQILLVASFLGISNITIAQVPSIQWQKSLGGTKRDGNPTSTHQTKDGGYIIVGMSESNDGDLPKNYGDLDFYVIKLLKNGNVEWQKVFGGTGMDVATTVIQTKDSGYIIAGYTTSNDGDVSGNHGNEDCWVLKLNNKGGVEWQKCYGGSNSDEPSSIQQTSDGGFIVAGQSNSSDGDLTKNHGDYDFWVLKLSSIGSIQWQKSIGGSGYDGVSFIQQSKDGGYIVAGTSGSVDGDVTGNNGNWDYLVVKLDSIGNIRWEKNLGGSDIDILTTCQLTPDGGCIVAGFTNSKDGDVTGNHGYSDSWLVKLDSVGNMLWQKCLGGSDVDVAYFINLTSDGGYIMAGNSLSKDGDVTNNKGNDDVWIVKVDSIGNLQWQETFGGSEHDVALFIQQIASGEYFVVGHSNSANGDVIGNHGSWDIWVMKLGDSTLPLKLQSFAAQLANRTISTQWHTSTELNTSHFIIQHSTDGSSFKDIGIVNAKGSGANGYQFTDNNPPLGINYYRLKSVDKDGSFSYSKVVSAQLSVNSNQLSVFPNPSKDKVMVKGSHIVSIQVVDNLGRVLKIQNLKDATNPILSVSALPVGVYHLRIQTTDGKVSGIGFVKE